MDSCRLTLRQKDPSAYNQAMRFLAVITLALLVLTGCQSYPLREDAKAHRDAAAEFKRIRPLAEQGDAGAQYRLGVMYQLGWGVTKDYKEAIRWYRRVAEQGDADAQKILGNM